MAKVALVILGNIQQKAKLFEELKETISEYKDSDELHICHFSNHVNSSDFSKQNYKLHFIEPPVNENIDIDAVFKTKQQLDDLNILCCQFLLDSSNQLIYQEICKCVFPPVYDVTFQVSECVQCFSSTLTPDNAKEQVQKYLSCIPSSDAKSVAIHYSKLIPKMFVHGYSSRQGGISSYGGLSSLNLCYSLRKRDSRLVIQENRVRLAKAANFRPQSFYLAKAVHGKDVWIYGEKEPESYDALISNTPNVVIAAPGADCNMLLFADPVSKSCGATHAGWKGILCGAIQATVEAMTNSYGVNPKDLIVSIGPSLSVCCCEFGAEESKKFLSIDEKCVVWKPGSPKPFLDLRLAARILLQKCGVLSFNIDDGTGTESDLDICTKCDPKKRFFSFRRLGPQFGNQVGFIGLLA